MDTNETSVRWDMLAGLAMIAFASVFLVVGLQLNFGTPSNMGPGFLPVITAAILAVLGLIIAVEGFFEKPTMPSLPRLRPFAVVVACPIVFGVMIGWAGMVPTVVVTALLARMAEPLKWGWDLLLVPLSLSVLSVVIFIKFIGVAIPAF